MDLGQYWLQSLMWLAYYTLDKAVGESVMTFNPWLRDSIRVGMTLETEPIEAYQHQLWDNAQIRVKGRLPSSDTGRRQKSSQWWLAKGPTHFQK